MGKTAFALNIAENVTVLGGAPVLFVSLEMSGIELADRLLCSVARVNGHRLRRHNQPRGSQAIGGEGDGDQQRSAVCRRLPHADRQ